MTAMMTQHSLRDITLFLVDVDGVVVRGKTSILGAAQAIDSLHKNEAKVIFVTNNSSRSRASLARELREFGIATSPDETLTTAYIAARYLLTIGAKTTFIVGESGLREELGQAGIAIVQSQAEACDAVVVGIDTEYTYKKMAAANRFIRQGAKFIATNTDATLPTEEGEIPGAGAIVSSLATCTGIRPTILGKPDVALVQAALQTTGLAMHQTAVVGDRPETDIAMAQRAGCMGILVLTGVSTHARREDYLCKQRPHLIFRSIRALAEAYAEMKQMS